MCPQAFKNILEKTEKTLPFPQSLQSFSLELCCFHTWMPRLTVWASKFKCLL